MAKNDADKTKPESGSDYSGLVAGIAGLLADARRRTARAIDSVLTATYWEVGRRLVEYEQGGKRRAQYGKNLLEKVAGDLTRRFGRGFGVDNLERMRLFYETYPPAKISAALARNSGADPGAPNSASAPRNLDLSAIAGAFPLSWTHYLLLLRRCRTDAARAFYETEALRGGWSVRQLERQIESQFYERTALSRDKAAMLKKGQKALPADAVTAEEEIKSPYVLEFLGLKDEYSENDLEDALIRHLEAFLLELGGDFTFVARQKRLRIGDEWFRVDLVFYHRRLRCLVLIDLKIGKLTHADAGQMHMYLTYAREQWTNPDENPPVGLILCAYKDAAVAKYALDSLPNKVLAAEYKTALPREQVIEKELERTRRLLEERRDLKK